MSSPTPPDECFVLVFFDSHPRTWSAKAPRFCVHPSAGQRARAGCAPTISPENESVTPLNSSRNADSALDSLEGLKLTVVYRRRSEYEPPFIICATLLKTPRSFHGVTYVVSSNLAGYPRKTRPSGTVTSRFWITRDFSGSRAVRGRWPWYLQLTVACQVPEATIRHVVCPLTL